MNHQETIAQLGGHGRLKAFVGAQNFMVGTDSVSFRFKGSKKANYLKITLDPSDTYILEFGKIRGHEYKVTKTLENIYCDQLVEIFEDTTDLFLSF